MEKLSVVVNPGQPGDFHELRSQDLVPDLDHLWDLGEKSMPTNVETIALEYVRASMAPHDTLFFENNGYSIAFAQLVGCRQTCGTGACYQHLLGSARIPGGFGIVAN